MDKFDPIVALYDYKKEYNYAKDAVDNLEKLTQDLLHKLELDNTKYSEKAKIATQLSIVRKDRRHYKNIIDVYEPLMALDSLMVSKVAIALATAKQRNTSLDKRSYKPRILKIELVQTTPKRKQENK